MTTPTQAQIEAIEIAKEHLQRSCMPDAQDTLAKIIALTAAAQIGQEQPAPPTQAQVDAARRELVGLVVITGDSTWDMDYVARRVLAAAAQANKIITPQLTDTEVSDLKKKWDASFK